MATFPKNPKPSLALQRLHLHNTIAGSRSNIQRGVLLWSGEIKPLPLGQTYTISLRYKLSSKYRLDELPKVRVVSPILESRENGQIPHRYSGGSLCLFYPPNFEWTGYKLLAHTIIPWTSEWLSHYEIWLVTGTWYGGGIHNELPKESSGVLKE
jgi:hypothetical protein